MDNIKILIDTDIGDEIDDALALYLAIKMRLDIVGVTTVYQNTSERARIAKMLLKKYGGGYENAPVYSGNGTPLAAEKRLYPHTCHYNTELENKEYAPDGNNAEDFIIEQCEKWGKQLVIVALGPFTNIAKVIKKAPETLGKAKKVVIMGGAYFKQYADWNVMCDVEAANIMFNSLDNLECIGADVTHGLPLSDFQMQLLCSLNENDAAKEIARFVVLWQKANPHRLPALHDPLAVYYAAHPDICQMTEQRIAVITEGFARGLTLNVDAYNKAYLNTAYLSKDIKSHLVAADVDTKRFIDSFLKAFE